MKISKKTIIIAIVAAVAAYLLWKKGKEGNVASLGDATLTAAPDTTSLNYILTHVSFTADERKKIEALRKAAEASEMTYQGIVAKANANGLSYDQQLVLDAIWLLYTQDGQWKTGPDGTSSYGWNLQQKVLNL